MKIGKLNVNPSEITLAHWSNFSIDPILGKQAEETLKRGVEILEKTEINHWVASGTLLGIYRDKKLIDHDTDIDVSVSGKWDSLEMNNQSKQLAIGLTNNDFRVIRTQIYKNHFMQFATIDETNGVIFDVCFFYSGIVPGKVVHLCQEGYYLMPSRLVNRLYQLDFKGRKYPIPHRVKEHLKWQYGNWEKPTNNKVAWQEEAPSLNKWK